MSVEREVAREQRIERLIREIGEVIDDAEPERREELRQMAADLLNEQTRQMEIADGQAAGAAATGRPLNLLTLGVSLLVLGLVLFLLVPFMASVLVAVGFIAIISSLLYRFVRPSLKLKFRH